MNIANDTIGNLRGTHYSSVVILAVIKSLVSHGEMQHAEMPFPVLVQNSRLGSELPSFTTVGRQRVVGARVSPRQPSPTAPSCRQM